MSDLYLNGAGPSRGSELGTIKYRNTENTSRNYVIDRGEGCTMTEYNKSKASTNYSFHVVRYLPDSLNILIILYLVYIRPFAKALFRNTLPPQTKTRKTMVKKVPGSVSK